jgi:hypothetical protein
MNVIGITKLFKQYFIKGKRREAKNGKRSAFLTKLAMLYDIIKPPKEKPTIK